MPLAALTADYAVRICQKGQAGCCKCGYDHEETAGTLRWLEEK